MAKLYDISGRVQEIEAKEYSLEEYYKMLDCTSIDVYEHPDPDFIVIMDEEGGIKPNRKINVNFMLETGIFLFGSLIVLPKKFFN